MGWSKDNVLTEKTPIITWIKDSKQDLFRIPIRLDKIRNKVLRNMQGFS